MILHDDPRLDTGAFSSCAVTPFQSQYDQTWQIMNAHRDNLKNRAGNLRNQNVQIERQLGRLLPNPFNNGARLDGPHMTVVDYRDASNPTQTLNLPQTGRPIPSVRSDRPYSTPSPVTQNWSSAATSSASHGKPSRLRADASSFVPGARSHSLLAPTSAFPPPISTAYTKPNPACSANPVAPTHIVPTTPYGHFGSRDSTKHLPQLSVQGNSQGNPPWTRNPPRMELSLRADSPSRVENPQLVNSVPRIVELPESQSKDESSEDSWTFVEETTDSKSDVDTPNTTSNTESDQIAADQEGREDRNQDLKKASNLLARLFAFY